MFALNPRKLSFIACRLQDWDCNKLKLHHTLVEKTFTSEKQRWEKRSKQPGHCEWRRKGKRLLFNPHHPPHVPIWHLSIVYSHTQHCIVAQVPFSTNQPFICVTVLATEKISKLNFMSVRFSLLKKYLLPPPAKFFPRYFPYFPAPSLLAQFGKTHFFLDTW